jgi:hypothetical protein
MAILEKLEHQRRNPHLYTTLSQCVNADGTITTFDDVTRELQKTLKALDEAHTKQFGGEHPVYCMLPVIGTPAAQVCQMIEALNQDMDRCRLSFVTNYKRIADRLTSLSTKEGEL